MNNMIAELKPGEIFVFGSNLNGHHIGGAAKTAHEQFGAKWGVGEGMTGNCYAFPTLDEQMGQMNTYVLICHRNKLYECATKNPDKTFLLTKVGCGIAGYDQEDIKRLFLEETFEKRPTNIILPKGW